MKKAGLVNHLRAWGLNVTPVSGWQNRGRPYKFAPRAIIVHHDASPPSSGNAGALRVVTSGRAGLSGPLSQFVLGRDGRVYVVAAGYANHAGTGGPRKNIPRNMGNTYSIGIEAANNGVGEKWSKKQLNAYYRLCAALLVWIKVKDVNVISGHKEWTTRKIDPAGINMNNFRKNVAAALKSGPTAQTVRLSNLKYGRRNNDVKKVKKALAKKGFKKSAVNSPIFGTGLRADYSAWQRRLGYTGKDADGIPGRTSLERLGFIVLP